MAVRTLTRFIRPGLVLLLALLAGIKIALASDYAFRLDNRSPLSTLSASSAAYAEQQFASRDYGSAQIASMQALRSTPLSSEALRTLALSLQEQGKLERAGEAMTLAAALGWRDTATQLWLLAMFAQQGDFASAIVHADALARRHEADREVMAFLMAVALHPTVREYLIERLAQRPDWGDAFFNSVAELPEERIADFESFMNEFAISTGGLPTEYLAKFVDHVYRLGDVRRAREYWFRHFRESKDAHNILFDGGIDHAKVGQRVFGSPFEWKISRVAGIDVEIAPVPRAALGSLNSGLSVKSGGNIPARIASQKVALKPGAYRLSMTVITGSDIAKNASWAVRCGTGQEILARETEEFDRSSHQHIAYAFVVPNDRCVSQTIILAIHNRSAEPFRIWLDDISLAAAHD